MLVILIVFLTPLVYARRCYESPHAICKVCSKWERVTSGDFFCEKLPNKNVSNDNNYCRMSTASEHVCLEERIYDISTMACTKAYKTNAGDTCDSIAVKFDVSRRSLQELNKPDICKKMRENLDICVEGIHDCPKVAYPRSRENCMSFLERFGLSEQQWQMWNSKIECSMFLTEQKMLEVPLCVEDPCSRRHKVESEDESFTTIANQHDVTVDHLIWNNEALTDIEELPIATSVCLWRWGQHIPNVRNEAGIIKASTEGSCESMATRYALSFEMFMENNDILDCDDLTETPNITVGFTETGNCLDYIYTSEVVNTCDKLVKFVDSKYLLTSLNSKICSNFKLGKLVCLQQSQRPIDTVDLAEKLKLHSSQIASSLLKYKAGPSRPNRDAIYTALLRETVKAAMIIRVEKLYEDDYSASSIFVRQTRHVRREDACKWFRDSAVFADLDYIAECFCDPKQLLFYCGALIFEEAEKFGASRKIIDGEGKSITANDPCYLGPPQTDRKHGGCVIPGCRIDYRGFSIQIDQKMCWPSHASPLKNGAYCKRNGNCFADYSEEVVARICSTDPVLQFAFAGQACIPVGGAYSAQLGILRLHTVNFYNFFKIEVRMSIKINEIHPEMIKERYCDLSSSRCEDYCAWRNEPFWRVSGFLSTSLDFMDFKYPVSEHLFPFPYQTCFGNLAVVTIENQRTRKGNLTVRCYSSRFGNEYFMNEELTPYNNKNQVSFKVNSDTVVTCILKDGVSENVSLDVYGGYNAPIGRKIHTYRVLEENIEYIAEDTPDQSKIVLLWT